MDIKKYEVLLQALESGTFSEVAERLDYTQSGISHMMKNLEEHFGFPLFHRKHSGIALTRNGEEMLPYIRTLVKANSALQEQVSYLNGYQKGKIVLGAFSSFCIKFLLPIVRQFRKKYPSIQLTFYTETSTGLEKMLQENRIDVGFFCDSTNPNFNKQYMYNDPMYVVVPLNHPAASWKFFPYEAFDGEDFIVPSSTGDCETSRFIEAQNIELDCPIYALNTVSAIAMVESGLGITMISELSLKTFPYKVASIPLDPPHSRHIYMFTPKTPELSPATKMFTEYCLDMMETIEV